MCTLIGVHSDQLIRPSNESVWIFLQLCRKRVITHLTKHNKNITGIVWNLASKGIFVKV